MPEEMVNNKSDSFTIYILHKNVTKRGITTVCVLYGLLSRASNNKSRAVCIDAGEGFRGRFSPLCSSLNKPWLLGSSMCLPTKTLTTAQGCPTFQWILSLMGRITRAPYLPSPPPICFNLERTSIPNSIILVPATWMMCKISYTFICT